MSERLGEAGVDQVDADTPAIPRWWGISAFVLSLLGFADALYLTIEHFNGAVPSCPATGVISCAKVTTSPQSYVFHIPVALLGLLFFAGMIVINVPPLWRTRYRAVAWIRLAMVTVGLGMVVYLVSAELFSIKAICLWCTGVHIISVLLFILVVATLPTLLAVGAGAGPDWDGGDDYEEDDDGQGGTGPEA